MAIIIKEIQVKTRIEKDPVHTGLNEQQFALLKKEILREIEKKDRDIYRNKRTDR